MSMITICLIAMLFAAWKAPRWVKEAGLAALMLGWIYFMTGLYDISEIIGSGQLAGISSESKLAILCIGVRVTVIAPTNGMIGYLSNAQQIVEGGYEPRDSATYFALAGTYTMEIDRIIRAGLRELSGKNENQ